MKFRFSLAAVLVACVVSGLAQARDYEPREPRQRSFVVREREGEAARDEVRERFMERRERMRSLREEMQRPPLRSPSYQDDEDRRPRPDDRDLRRPPPREMESFRRLSPEERRAFRRQLHEAGRDVYRE